MLHKRKSTKIQFAGMALTAMFSVGTGTCAGNSHPNIIIILADDMGYGDAGCYNKDSKIPTSYLDQMAAEGLRFTDVHTSSALSTPSRYSLLTGRYNWRTRLKRGVLDGFAPPLIEESRPTIAGFLKANGYETACIGKWHLGMQWTAKDGSLINDRSKEELPKGFRSGTNIDFSKPVTGGPTAVGFNSFFGISASLDMSPYCWIQNDRCVSTPVNPIGLEKEDLFVTHGEGLVADDFKPELVLPTLKKKAVEWISQHTTSASGTPFFLYLPLNSPHLPVVPSPEFVGKSGAGLYGDFVMETDDFVGAVIGALKANGIYENTMVVFTSDNGSLWHEWNPVEPDDIANYKPTLRAEYTYERRHQCNGELKGTKADVWEGGHRVPFLLQWPAEITAGTVRAPVELTDMFATIAEIVSGALPDDAAPDSFSFYPAMKDPAVEQTDRPFLIHHTSLGLFSIRQGDWKYVEFRGSGGFSYKLRPKPGEAKGQLYNLRNDVSETKNLFTQEPERVTQLQKLLNEAKAGESLRSGKFN